jgi:hypothetical protein
MAAFFLIKIFINTFLRYDMLLVCYDVLSMDICNRATTSVQHSGNIHDQISQLNQPYLGQRSKSVVFMAKTSMHSGHTSEPTIKLHSGKN